MIATERHELTNPTPALTGKDCYSRAFHLAGLLDEERPLQTHEIGKLLKACTTVTAPAVGGFVHVYNGETGHIVYITGLNPITVSDRAGIGGETREGMLLTDVLFEYGGLDIPTVYLQPM